MPNAEVAAYIGRWQPSTVSAQAAAFARDAITAVQPEGRERAKNLLWAAGKLMLLCPVKGSGDISWSHFLGLKKGGERSGLLDCGQDREGPLG